MVGLRFCFGIVLVCDLLCQISDAAESGSPRNVCSLDSQWRFVSKDEADGFKPDLNDSSWRLVDVPHDWSIEGPVESTNPTRGAGGFFPGGVGWYRKQFNLTQADAAKKVFVDFDAVMANSDVWINGFDLGHRPNGYVSLHYELTGHLNFGAGTSNTLAVRVDQSAQPSSRYYTGAGIIGHVRLTTMNQVHLAHDSVFVTTPKIELNRATVHLQATVLNRSETPRNILLRSSIEDSHGKPVQADVTSAPQTVAPGASLDLSQDLLVPDPRLWDLDHPELYQLHVVVVEQNQALDEQSVLFGIRTPKFEPATGFSLNGKNIRIQGVCLHADVSCLGAAVPLAAWEQRLTALKSLGVNAIRTAHNPPTPDFLNLCDRMGFLVMDEMFDCWEVAKNPYDYHLYFDKWSLTDLRDTVQRDRNHPCVILYSAGNEIHDTPNAAASIRILSGLIKEFHTNDPTRPVTQALLRPNRSHDYDDGLADLLDVIGTNYRMTELLAAQRDKPARLLIGTENHPSDIPFLADHPPLAGIFIWTGADYLGEAQRWPQFANTQGFVDRTNRAKAGGYLAAATWSNKPFVKIYRGIELPSRPIPPMLPPGAAGDDPVPATQPAIARPPRGAPHGQLADWTPNHLDAHFETVTLYSNCPKVELSLNGKQLSENLPTGNSQRGAHVFNVEFAPGTLKALAIDASGNTVATDELQTAGPAVKVALTIDRLTVPNDWNDVAYIRATITDANGIAVPSSDQEIQFSTSGPGSIVAVDSGDSRYHESFQASRCQLWEGTCVAVVKANQDMGTIVVTATAENLKPAMLMLTATKGNR